jgi:hypothetical protein
MKFDEKKCIFRMVAAVDFVDPVLIFKPDEMKIRRNLHAHI